MPAPPPPPPTPSPMKGTPNTTRFVGSQLGGKSVITYSYTDMPWKLMAWDVYYFFRYLWAIPYILWPLTPTDSAELSELSLISANFFCLGVHFVLCILQLVFILALPFMVVLPVWTAVGLVGAFMLVNRGLCGLLNGEGVEYRSGAEYAEARPEHAHEQWIYINGVAAGEHWMKSNLNRIAVTFKRPVLGIHNKTSGILFDVIECLIQRNWGYATKDVRVGYQIIKKKLYNPRYSKVVFILHSQGAIEGSLILDWLLQELPQDLLAKLEVYTFGNAANHFNNPHRHVRGQEMAMRNPLAASLDETRLLGHRRNPSFSSSSSSSSSFSSSSSSSPSPSPSPLTLPPSHTPHTPSDRAIFHIEHYAHTTDFVALWGVLHFTTSSPASPIIPRFLGRVFIRNCVNGRGGHQFVQHYLDGMFPLKRDKVTGELVRGEDGVPVGCEDEEGNEFMEGEVDVEVGGGCGGVINGVKVGVGIKDQEDDSDDDGGGKGEVEVLGVSPVLEMSKQSLLNAGGEGTVRVKVKELSRLWQYRNGRSPPEKPPLLVTGENGVVRNATM